MQFTLTFHNHTEHFIAKGRAIETWICPETKRMIYGFLFN